MAKILIVDDSPDILFIFSTIIEMQGDQAISFLSGHSLIENIIDNKPDIIILDIRLGGYNGLEICKEIRAHEAIKDIPVILASASIDLLEGYELCGAVAVIEKPFNIDEVHSSINAVLQRTDR